MVFYSFYDYIDAKQIDEDDESVQALSEFLDSINRYLIIEHYNVVDNVVESIDLYLFDIDESVMYIKYHDKDEIEELPSFEIWKQLKILNESSGSLFYICTV